MTLTGCNLNLFGIPYGCSTFTPLAYSISYFPYSEKASVFSRMSSHRRSVISVGEGLKEKDC